MIVGASLSRVTLLSGALVLGLGLCLIFLAATGLVFRYVQPGFRPWVGAAGALLTALGVWTFSSIAEDRTAGPFPRVGAASPLPILLVAAGTAGGRCSLRLLGHRSWCLDQPHPALTSSVNEMTLLELYESATFSTTPPSLTATPSAPPACSTVATTGGRCDVSASSAAPPTPPNTPAPITGTVPHAQEGKWVEADRHRINSAGTRADGTQRRQHPRTREAVPMSKLDERIDVHAGSWVIGNPCVHHPRRRVLHLAYRRPAYHTARTH